MIIETICNALYSFVSVLLSWINIPQLDENFLSSFTAVFNLVLDNAKGIISVFIPWQLVRLAIPLVLIMAVVRYGYPLVMWVLRKIPFLNIS